MEIKGLVSIIIPSRNEPYLEKTVRDVLKKAVGNIEVIVFLDGWWDKAENIVDDKRVIYIHKSKSIGMRGGINSCVAISKGEYLLKIDAHILFEKGFDEVLKKYHKDNWVQVPRRYSLDVFKWEMEKRNDDKYPVDYAYLDKEFHGREWREKNKDESLKYKHVDSLMSSQGSCWFMKKSYYHSLELMDEENYGTFAREFQEISLKCWLSGGQVMVNKNTWYAHWHKTESRGYSLDHKESDKATKFMEKWMKDKGWHKQTLPIDWLINKFSPVPTWIETT